MPKKYIPKSAPFRRGGSCPNLQRFLKSLGPTSLNPKRHLYLFSHFRSALYARNQQRERQTRTLPRYMCSNMLHLVLCIAIVVYSEGVGVVKTPTSH